MGRTRKALAVAAAASACLAVSPAIASSGVPPCRIVNDPAGDAVLRSIGPVSTPDQAALDVISADIASGSRNLTLVVRVAQLGSAVEAAPRLDQWIVYFTFRGHGFAATAARAVDGTEFYLAGDFPEKSAAPGFTATVPVSGTFVEGANEVRLVVPRDLVGRTKKGDKISKITVDTVTGVGTLATETTGAYAGTTVDRTAQRSTAKALTGARCLKAEGFCACLRPARYWTRSICRFAARRWWHSAAPICERFTLLPHVTIAPRTSWPNILCPAASCPCKSMSQDVSTQLIFVNSFMTAQ